jgi:hypothetical protein
MTTIVNSAAPNNDSNGFGFLFGIIILIGLILVFVFFGLPALKNMGAIQLNIPTPQIIVPDKIDVSVKQSK